MWILFPWTLSGTVDQWIKSLNTYTQTHVHSFISRILKYAFLRWKIVASRAFKGHTAVISIQETEFYSWTEPKSSPRPLFSSWSISVTKTLSDFIYYWVEEWMQDPRGLIGGSSSMKCPCPPSSPPWGRCSPRPSPDDSLAFLQGPMGGGNFSQV